MFFPLLSVTLIGLAFALRAPADVGSQSTAARIGITGAWMGFVLGAIAGFFIEVVMIGGFWVGLIGHIGAFVGARGAIEGDRLLGSSFGKRRSLSS